MTATATSNDTPASADTHCSACSTCDVHFYLRRHVVPDDTMAMATQAVRDRDELLKQVQALKKEVEWLRKQKDYPGRPWDGRIWLAAPAVGGETPISVHNRGD